jgi:ferritin-like metal-binding protein YciE
MAMNSLQELYQNKLQMILDAEQQALQAMTQMAQMISNPELRQGFEMHRRQSEEQVRRLEQVVQRAGKSSQATQCQSMRALIDEGQRIAQQIDDPDTLDAHLIGGQQAIEHHEIAAYGTVRTWARHLGRNDDAQLLQQTLQEEEQADRLLTSIAERMVNPQAAGSERDVTSSPQMADMPQTGGSGSTRSTGTTEDRPGASL